VTLASDFSDLKKEATDYSAAQVGEKSAESTIRRSKNITPRYKILFVLLEICNIPHKTQP